jgi:hypothetical protein
VCARVCVSACVHACVGGGHMRTPVALLHPSGYISKNVQMDSHPPPQLATAWVPGPPSPGLKQPGHDDDH